MISDCLLAGCIVRVVGFYFDGSSILKKQKMVRGHFVAEAHCQIAPLIDTSEVFRICRGGRTEHRIEDVDLNRVNLIMPGRYLDSRKLGKRWIGRKI